MKLIRLSQDTGKEVRSVWVSPIHIVAIEPISGGDPGTFENNTLIRTTVGAGYAMDTPEEVVALLDAWRGDDKPPVKATRGKRNG